MKGHTGGPYVEIKYGSPIDWLDWSFDSIVVNYMRETEVLQRSSDGSNLIA